jgi:small-conductance mechanosensitive channel
VVAERIREAAIDPSYSAEKVTAAEKEDRTIISFGNKLLLSLLDLDASAEGVSRKILAEVIRGRIIAGINDYRAARQPQVLIENAGYAIIVALLFAAAIFGLVRAFRWLRRRTVARIERKLKEFEVQSRHFIQAEQLGAVVTRLLSGLQWLAILILAVLFLQLVLGLFPWTRRFAEELLGLFIKPLETMGQGIVDAFPDLVFLLVLTMLVVYVLRASRLFFAGLGAGTITVASFEKEWAGPTYRILRLVIVAFAVVVGYPYIPGSGSEAFKGVTIFLGVVFSLGSTSFISNIVAGYTMIFRRAFQVGDRVSIDKFVGYVTEIGVSVTRLRTPKNEIVVLPNSLVLNSSLVNYSALARSQGLILHTTVGIGYETPWRQVEAMLLKAAAQCSGILKDPPPFVLQTALGDFCITYELNAYCDAAEKVLELYAELHRNVLDVFNEFGVQIMTPAYISDPTEPKVVPKENWYTAPAREGK